MLLILYEQNLRYRTDLSVFLRLQNVKINIEGCKNKFYNIFATVKELLFIFDYATKYSLHNPQHLFANLLIITLTGDITWAVFIYIEVIRINSLHIGLQCKCFAN